MVKPVDMDDSRRGPDTDIEARRRRNSFVWVWAVLAIVLILAVGALMSFAAKGLGGNAGAINRDPSYIEDAAKRAAKGGGPGDAPAQQQSPQQ